MGRRRGSMSWCRTRSGGCWGRARVCGGLRRRPPRPPRVPAAPAAVLSEAGGCGRGARPGMKAVGGAGIVIPAEARQGARISIAVERMLFEGGGTLPPRFFPLPNGQDVVGAFSEGPPGGTGSGTAVPGGLVCGGLGRRPRSDEHSDTVNASLGCLRRPGWRPAWAGLATSRGEGHPPLKDLGSGTQVPERQYSILPPPHGQKQVESIARMRHCHAGRAYGRGDPFASLRASSPFAPPDPPSPTTRTS